MIFLRAINRSLVDFFLPMTTIYRKYRPKTFAEVAGQNHIKVTLMNEIMSGHPAHAYIFVGPRGTGKTTVARLLARAINCTGRKANTAEPCSECDSCKQILDGRSLDIIEIDAATHTQVDNVRDNIITSAQVPPYAAKGYKVFIIDEVHMLSKHAFNALLKTIEEPPQKIVFILATTDVYKVPETVISRCQRFDFHRLSQKLINERLATLAGKEGIAVPPNIIAAVARRSAGFMRDAESLLGQVLSLAENRQVTAEQAQVILPPDNWQSIAEFTDEVLQRNISAALQRIQSLTNEGVDVESFTSDAVEFTRQLLLRKTIGPSYIPDADEKSLERISLMAEKFAAPEIQSLLELLFKNLRNFKTASISSLPLELATIEYCELGNGTTVTTAAQLRRPVLAAQESMTANKKQITPEFDQLRQSWNSVIAELKKFNHSLSMFLKVSHPLRLSDNRLAIGFQYDFHAAQIKEHKNKLLVEEAISKILGRDISIDCEIDSDYTANHKNFNGSKEKEVQDILEVLGGGEVV